MYNLVCITNWTGKKLIIIIIIIEIIMNVNLLRECRGYTIYIYIYDQQHTATILS